MYGGFILYGRRYGTVWKLFFFIKGRFGELCNYLRPALLLKIVDFYYILCESHKVCLLLISMRKYKKTLKSSFYFWLYEKKSYLNSRLLKYSPNLEA